MSLNSNERYVSFLLGDMVFEYDENKNAKNIKKHGISFQHAVRVFFDYDRIELFDEENSQNESRFDIIGNISFQEKRDDIVFVVYTERVKRTVSGKEIEINRIISARYATNFERGLYYGKF